MSKIPNTQHSCICSLAHMRDCAYASAERRGELKTLQSIRNVAGFTTEGMLAGPSVHLNAPEQQTKWI